MKNQKNPLLLIPDSSDIQSSQEQKRLQSRENVEQLRSKQQIELKKLVENENDINEDQLLIQEQIQAMVKQKKVQEEMKKCKEEQKLDHRQPYEQNNLLDKSEKTISLQFPSKMKQQKKQQKDLAKLDSHQFNINFHQYEFTMENKNQAVQKLEKNAQRLSKQNRGEEKNIPDERSKGYKSARFQESYEKYALKQSGDNMQKCKLIDRNLIITQIQQQIDNIPVYFPYKPYDLQIDYMQSVIQALNLGENALLESPTGTGKTLCLLASVLSWVDHYNCQRKYEQKQKVNIIYCSRTHSQLKQVQSQLQKTCFRPTMSNFGSRDQFCIKQQFSGIKGRDLMEACSKAVKLQLKTKRKLELQEDTKTMNKDQNSLDNQKKQKAHTCEFYKSESEYMKIVEEKYLNKIISSEKIKSEGQMYGFCPYYYAFQIKQKADLIFMPYNYILDVDRLSRYEPIIKNSIIIFDEAHNVPEAACEGRTFSINSSIFDHIDVELKKLQYHPFMSVQLRQVSYVYENTRQMLTKQASSLKNQFYQMAEWVYNKSYANPNQYRSEDQFDVQQIFKPIDLRISIYRWYSPQIFNRLEYQKLSLQKKKSIHMKTSIHLGSLIKQANDFIEALKQTYDGIFQNIQKLMSFSKKCLDLIQEPEFENEKSDWWNKQISHYRLSVKCNMKEEGLNYELKLVCLTSTLTFSDLMKIRLRSIILTSGTITPLDALEKEIAVKFKVKLVNRHVIDNSQMHLGIVSRGIGNHSVMNFSYNQLQKDPKIYQNLVKTITHFSSIIPNGVLVIFPSYKIIKTFREQLTRDLSELNKLKTFKNICFQDKGTIDYIIQNFKNKAKTKRGAILFCVCRGKVSEGLDFADELCRAVIFVGVPFPNIKDPILKQKRDYYDKLSASMSYKNQIKCISGDEWYTLNTMRSVNQGVGRVIRHINDYGMILMLDNRYQKSNLKNLLPAWSQPNMKIYNNFSEINEKVNSFFKDMRQKHPTEQLKQERFQDFPEVGPLKKQLIKKKQFGKQVRETSFGKKNPLQIMMQQAKRNSQGHQAQKKGKKKDIDFL